MQAQSLIPGLVGGMSWESTVLYYQWINQAYKEKKGGLHSAPLNLHSVDFAHIERLQHNGDWLGAGDELAVAGQTLERAGSDFLVICSNTMHKVADQVTDAVSIPLLHIVDPTADAIRQQGISTVGLLGTGFTMVDDFYKGRMQEEYGVTVLVPDANDQADVHNIIYQELCLGVVKDTSRERYLQVIAKLRDQGAAGVILGCTEITLLVKQNHTEVVLFDTTELHATAIVERMLNSC